MGVLKFSITVGILVGLSAVLMQRYSPATIDRILSDPSVQEFTIKANKFIEETKVSAVDKGYPLYLKASEALKPVTNYVKAKLDTLLDINEESSESGSHVPTGKTDTNKKNKERIFTAEQLKRYDGKPGSKGLYLALLGQVFNVKKGKDHYGPGGGYEFFAGRDASRAYVTGKFDEEGLTDDIRGLTPQDYIGLSEWLSFYHKDYKYVGKLAGRYYTADGQETQYRQQAARWLAAAEQNKEREDDDKKMFPPCNSEWSQEKGTRVWCTTKSGGVDRSWVGVPRQLFSPGKSKPRCACVKDHGTPNTAPAGDSKLPPSRADRGDLDNPNLHEYPGCPPKDSSCHVGKDE